MTPEEKFLEFVSEHSADYIQGWLDGLSGAIEVLRSLQKKQSQATLLLRQSFSQFVQIIQLLNTNHGFP
ncbi:TPA: hypothetical protein U1311_000866 [Streptococcus suis]|nr:hypothetical protein [Streptococcus suis]